MANSSVNQFELRKRLQDAFRQGRYMITITTFDPNKKQALQHFWAWERFPFDDVIPSLGHIAGQIDEKDSPETGTESR